MSIKLKTLLSQVIREINEAEAAPKKYVKKLRAMLGQDYKTFVAQLKSALKDSKFRAALDLIGDQFDSVKFTNATPKVTDLKPTQNEVVLSNSLDYPLTDVASAKKYLDGGTVTVKGPIVTCNTGNYVIDGHHRWSQLFCVNPDAKITAIDMGNITDPVNALKSAQIGVAIDKGKIQTAAGGGQNLFTIGESEFKKYCETKITDPVIQVFVDHGIAEDKISSYLWKNVLTLRKTSKPISGATERPLMPQTEPSTLDASPVVERRKKKSMR